jgi:hypothetical protein
MRRRSVVSSNGIALTLMPEAGVDHALATAVMDAGGEQQGAHPALAIVEIGLEQRGRFARIHRGIVEIELGHADQWRGGAILSSQFTSAWESAMRMSEKG